MIQNTYRSRQRSQTSWHFFFVALVGAMLCSTGCDESESSTPRDWSAEIVVDTPPSVFALAATTGCLIDSDCASGTYCFQNACAWECSADVGCEDGAVCSARGRCLDPVLVSTLRPSWDGTSVDGVAPALPDFRDEEGVADVPSEIAEVEVIVAPDAEVEVDLGTPFVEVSLRTAAPVPGGVVLYRVEVDGVEGGPPRTERSEGVDRFVFRIPTGKASGQSADAEVQRIYLVASVGGFSVTLVPRISVDGLYAGEVEIREFGGAGIPLRFGLRVEPAGASFEEATARYILLPASLQDVFAPVAGGAVEAPDWYESELLWDDESEVWFGRYAADYSFPAASAYQRSGDAQRALRIEIAEIDGRVVQGALADRWIGLYDARSADGVVVPSTVSLSGNLVAYRVGRLPDEAYAATAAVVAPRVPDVGGLLPIDSCAGGVLTAMVAQITPEPPDLELGDEPAPPSGPCVGVTDTSSFLNRSASRRAHCAIALAEEALTGPTTAGQVRAFLDDSVPNPDGLSFSEFLERCAARQGYCVPTHEITCSEQLLAHAYQSQSEELPQAGTLLELYQEVAREAYLGRQLAAFQVDTNIRLEWLRTSIAPLFLASALRAYNEEILNRWERQVIDAHFEVLAQQFSPGSMEVLARAPTDAVALSVRRQLLLEHAQTWQGAMEALQIATQRWNSIYQNDVRREQAAQSVRTRVFDLYLSAAVLAQLGRSSGASSTNAVFGAGFASVLRSLEELSLPFNDLIFMRDAEVVVSRSVDPSSDSRTLLGELEELARRAVADAQQSVDRVIADAQADELNAQVLTGRIQTQVEELAAELVALCGLPATCVPSDLTTRPECRVRTTVGRCGFLVDPFTGEALSVGEIGAQESVSEAGRAVLGYRTAILGAQVAEEEFRANQQRAQMELESAEAFANKLVEWNARRADLAAEVASIAAEIDAIEAVQGSAEMAAIREMAQERERAYAAQAADVTSWATMRYDGVESDMRRMTTITALQQTGAWLTLTGSEIDRLAEVWADGMPKALGTANDATAPQRFIIGMSAYGVSTAMRAVSQGLQTAAAVVQLSLDEAQARRDAELSELSDLADLRAARTELELENLAANLRLLEMRTEAEIGTREALIDALRRQLEIDLAYERDLFELRDRRDRARIRLAESAQLRVEVLRAEVVAAQRHLEYMQIVQRAQLIEGRYAALNERLENLTILIGSPAVIFAFANRLARAEARIERAKRLLYDWLVALEYYAVRPFIDQRMAILLARNPSQLEAIANELLRLERVCGGIVNYEVADLSVRDDMLRVGYDLGASEARPTGMERGERFRTVLARGNVPIDMRVRYSTDERIGDLVRSRQVLAASFPIRLDDFANLPLTCNAKVASIEVQLVGPPELGRGRPTVSVLYDGTSTLRSCQPNIDDIVGALGPGTTAFGRLTRFRTSGRSVSPVATINTWGEPGTGNRGLEGLPLASTYTVLIDPQSGENAHIRWELLEDIRLRVTYVYQDVFPMGQCE